MMRGREPSTKGVGRGRGLGPAGNNGGGCRSRAGADVDGLERTAVDLLTMAQHRGLLKRFNPLAAAFVAHGLLSPGRGTWSCFASRGEPARCASGAAVLIACEADVTDHEVAWVACDDLDGWPNREQTLVRFTDELTARRRRLGQSLGSGSTATERGATRGAPDARGSAGVAREPARG